MGSGMEAKRILLIDDNEQGLLARRILLEDLGYEIETASNGADGLRCFGACAESAPFDLVVTDYRMPGLRGDEVVERLRQAAPGLPVVILTGYAEPLALTPESTGADLVLSKGPREQFELVDVVLQLVPDGARRPSKPPATERNSLTGRRTRHQPPRRRTSRTR